MGSHQRAAFLTPPSFIFPTPMVYFLKFHLDQEINPAKGYPKQAIFQPVLFLVQLTGYLCYRRRGFWRVGNQGDGCATLNNTWLGNWGCFVRKRITAPESSVENCLHWKNKSVLKSGLFVTGMSANELVTKALGFSSLPSATIHCCVFSADSNCQP